MAPEFRPFPHQLRYELVQHRSAVRRTLCLATAQGEPPSEQLLAGWAHAVRFVRPVKQHPERSSQQLAARLELLQTPLQQMGVVRPYRRTLLVSGCTVAVEWHEFVQLPLYRSVYQLRHVSEQLGRTISKPAAVRLLLTGSVRTWPTVSLWQLEPVQVGPPAPPEQVVALLPEVHPSPTVKAVLRWLRVHDKVASPLEQPLVQ